MKNLFLTFIVLIISFSKSYAQCDSSKLCYYNRDTISYFRNVFENNKSQFINFSLEKLIQKLEVKPLMYNLSIQYKNIDSCNGINIFFTGRYFYNRKTRVRIKLMIFFENLIIEDSCVEQLKKDNSFWLYNTRQFYGSRIIKDFEFIEVQY